MKDRFPLDAWPAEWIAHVVADMSAMSRETKLFLAKAMRMCAIAAQDLKKAG
jgi:predicted transcriptional regulator